MRHFIIRGKQSVYVATVKWILECNRFEIKNRNPKRLDRVSFREFRLHRAGRGYVSYFKV